MSCVLHQTGSLRRPLAKDRSRGTQRTQPLRQPGRPPSLQTVHTNGLCDDPSGSRMQSPHGPVRGRADEAHARRSLDCSFIIHTRPCRVCPLFAF